MHPSFGAPIHQPPVILYCVRVRVCTGPEGQKRAKEEKIEIEIEKELVQAQKEIIKLKKNSISDIHNISKEIAANIIENISGDKLNESSIKAAVEEISKKNVGKYL